MEHMGIILLFLGGGVNCFEPYPDICIDLFIDLPTFNCTIHLLCIYIYTTCVYTIYSVMYTIYSICTIYTIHTIHAIYTIYIYNIYIL